MPIPQSGTFYRATITENNKKRPPKVALTVLQKVKG